MNHRGFAGSIGTSALLVSAALVTLLVAGALLAFHGFPGPSTLAPAQSIVVGPAAANKGPRPAPQLMLASVDPRPRSGSGGGPSGSERAAEPGPSSARRSAPSSPASGPGDSATGAPGGGSPDGEQSPSPGSPPGPPDAPFTPLDGIPDRVLPGDPSEVLPEVRPPALPGIDQVAPGARDAAPGANDAVERAVPGAKGVLSGPPQGLGRTLTD